MQSRHSCRPTTHTYHSRPDMCVGGGGATEINKASPYSLRANSRTRWPRGSNNVYRAWLLKCDIKAGSLPQAYFLWGSLHTGTSLPLSSWKMSFNPFDRLTKEVFFDQDWSAGPKAQTWSPAHTTFTHRSQIKRRGYTPPSNHVAVHSRPGQPGACAVVVSRLGAVLTADKRRMRRGRS